MDFNSVVNELKAEKVETVGINLQIPIENKKLFDSLCKSHGVTVTSVLNKFISLSIKESKLSSN